MSGGSESVGDLADRKEALRSEILKIREATAALSASTPSLVALLDAGGGDGDDASARWSAQAIPERDFGAGSGYGGGGSGYGGGGSGDAGNDPLGRRGSVLGRSMLSSRNGAIAAGGGTAGIGGGFQPGSLDYRSQAATAGSMYGSGAIGGGGIHMPVAYGLNGKGLVVVVVVVVVGDWRSPVQGVTPVGPI